MALAPGRIVGWVRCGVIQVSCHIREISCKGEAAPHASTGGTLTDLGFGVCMHKTIDCHRGGPIKLQSVLKKCGRLEQWHRRVVNRSLNTVCDVSIAKKRCRHPDTR